MLIIIEGPDGAGKTTLAREIVSASRKANLRVRELHRGAPSSSNLVREYSLDLRDYAPARDLIICDRWHMGERVYGTLLRGRSLMSQGTWWWLEMFLAARGAVEIVLAPPLSTLQQRIKEREAETGELEPPVIHETLEAAREMFLALAQTDTPLTRCVSSADVEPAELAARAVALAQREAARALRAVTSRGTLGSLIGSPTPTTLALGDTYGTSGERAENEGAFAPSTGSCGTFLCRQLAAQPVSALRVLHQLAIANSDNVARTTELLTQLQPHKVIALGARARERILAAGWWQYSLVTLPHPQYIRRFSHETGLSYAQELIAAVAAK